MFHILTSESESIT